MNVIAFKLKIRESQVAQKSVQFRWHIFSGGNVIKSPAILVKRAGKGVNRVQEGTRQTVAKCQVCEAHHIKQ